MSLSIAAPLIAIIFALAGRAVIDKVLALRGGPEAVAHWAQLASVADLVLNCSLAGIGTGLIVLLAQSADRQLRLALLRETAILSLLISAISVAAFNAFMPTQTAFIGGGMPGHWMTLAAFAGALLAVAALLSYFFREEKRFQIFIAVAVFVAVAPAAAVALAPTGASAIPIGLAAQIGTGLAPLAFVVWATRNSAQAHANLTRKLKRYILPGIAIGTLSPIASLLMRGTISSNLSWADMGAIQSFWRLTDWVTAIVSGIFSLWLLPQLSAASSDHQAFTAVLRRGWQIVSVAAAALALIVWQRQSLATLFFRADFVLSLSTASLIAAGDLARAAAWLPLFGLYARQQTLSITIGEVLSVPLFTSLVLFAGNRIDAPMVGALWLSAYLTYALFNFVMLARGRQTAVRKEQG